MKNKKYSPVKIDDVAAAAGVSKATVSRVMNRPYLVQEYTVKKVQKAMRELNYAPNAVAQSMRSQKTKTVGVVIPDLKNQFYAGMLNELEIELRRRDYMMIICPTSGEGEEELAHIARLMQRRVDGIMMFTYDNGGEHISNVLRITKELPFVLMDECKEDVPVNQVVTNGYGGVKQAVAHLAQKGHAKICYVGSNKEAGSKRLQGYLDAMSEAGIAPPEGYVLNTDGFNIDDGVAAAKKFLRLEERPSAAVCVTDSVAVGLMNELTARGVKIPDDLEVIGFNNIEIATVVTPTLSTVAQNMPELSERAVAMIMEMIDSPKKRRFVSTVKVEPELVLRNSTRNK